MTETPSRDRGSSLSRSTPRPIRLLFIQQGAKMAGVEMSTLFLAKRLDREAWRPLVICPTDGDLSHACERDRIDFRSLPIPTLYSTSFRLGTRVRLPNFFAWIWNVAAILIAARRLSPVLGECEAELVVTKGLFAHLYGGLAARWAGIPCIWHLQDFLSERLFGIYPLIFAKVARLLPRWVVADGRAIARQLPGIRAKTTIVLNGVDTSLYAPTVDGAPFREEMGIPAEIRLIGHVARITPWKGQHYLLEAFARVAREVSDASLILVGNALFDRDDYEHALRRRVDELGLGARVIFAGHRSDLPRVLAAMDIFAYPSVEKDTSPLSLLSALATGLPVVAFDIDGVREVLEEGEQCESGILVPVGSVELLSDKLLLLLYNRELRTRLGCCARRLAEESFSLPRHVARMEDVFLRSLDHRDGAPR